MYEVPVLQWHSYDVQKFPLEVGSPAHVSYMLRDFVLLQQLIKQVERSVDYVRDRDILITSYVANI